MKFHTGIAIALVACNTVPIASSNPKDSVGVLAGNEQVGTPGFVLTDSLAVQILDADGLPVEAVRVAWSTTNRDGAVSPEVGSTDVEGVARASWRLGTDDGLQRVTASSGTLTSGQFVAGAATGDPFQASGDVSQQCGRFVGDVVRCWEPPGLLPAVAIPIDTDLRFASLGFANGTWCGGTRSGAVACVDSDQMTPSGVFRPDAAPVTVVASGLPVFFTVLGSGDPEDGNTWCGVTGDGEIWCWGRNNTGQLGRGTIGGSVSIPAQVSGDIHGFRVALTAEAVCAVDLSAKAWCWGSVAQRVVDSGQDVAFPTVVPTEIRFSEIAGIASGSVCGLSEEVVYCWGSSANGGLGRDGVPNSPIPARIAGTDFYNRLGAASDGFLALTVDRGLVTWAGLGLVTNEGIPVRVLPGYVFTEILSGGGDGLLCVRAFPSGSRCVDRLALVEDLGGAATRRLQFGIPRE